MTYTFHLVKLKHIEANLRILKYKTIRLQNSVAQDQPDVPGSTRVFFFFFSFLRPKGKKKTFALTYDMLHEHWSNPIETIIDELGSNNSSNNKKNVSICSLETLIELIASWLKIKQKKRRTRSESFNIWFQEFCVHKRQHILNIFKSERRLNMGIERNSACRVKRRQKIYNSML